MKYYQLPHDVDTFNVDYGVPSAHCKYFSCCEVNITDAGWRGDTQKISPDNIKGEWKINCRSTNAHHQDSL